MTATTNATKRPDYLRYKLTTLGGTMTLWCVNCHSDNDGQVAEYQNTVDLPVDGIQIAIEAHEASHTSQHRTYPRVHGCKPHSDYVSPECHHAKADEVESLHSWCQMKCRMCGALCLCDCHGGKKAG